MFHNLFAKNDEFSGQGSIIQFFVQGMSVFLLTTNMRLFLNPIMIFFHIYLICEKPFLYLENFERLKTLTDKFLEQVVQGIGLALQALASTSAIVLL